MDEVLLEKKDAKNSVQSLNQSYCTILGMLIYVLHFLHSLPT